MCWLCVLLEMGPRTVLECFCPLRAHSSMFAASVFWFMVLLMIDCGMNPSEMVADVVPALASLSAFSFPSWSACPGIHMTDTLLFFARVVRLRALLQLIAVLLLKVVAERACIDERLSVRNVISLSFSSCRWMAAAVMAQSSAWYTVL